MRFVYSFLLFVDCIAMTIYLIFALKSLPEKIRHIAPEKNKKGKDWEVFRSDYYALQLLKLVGIIVLFYVIPQIVYVIGGVEEIGDSRAWLPVLIIISGTLVGCVALNLFFSRIGWENGIIEYKSRRSGCVVYMRKYFNKSTLGAGILTAMYFSVAWGLSIMKTILLFS